MKYYYLTCKIIASLLLVSEGMYLSLVHPSYFDLFNGGVAGFIIYVIWFMGYTSSDDKLK